MHVLRNAAYDLNSYLFSWGIMWRLFVSTGRLRRDEAGRLRRDEEGSLTISEISELPDAHRDEIYTAVGTWMTAITYNNAILGMLVRRLAFWGLMSVNDQIQDQDQNQECAPARRGAGEFETNPAKDIVVELATRSGSRLAA